MILAYPNIRLNTWLRFQDLSRIPPESKPKASQLKQPSLAPRLSTWVLRFDEAISTTKVLYLLIKQEINHEDYIMVQRCGHGPSEDIIRTSEQGTEENQDQ
jgi:hypothetical protein